MNGRLTNKNLVGVSRHTHLSIQFVVRAPALTIIDTPIVNLGNLRPMTGDV